MCCLTRTLQCADYRPLSSVNASHTTVATASLNTLGTWMKAATYLAITLIIHLGHAQHAKLHPAGYPAPTHAPPYGTHMLRKGGHCYKRLCTHPPLRQAGNAPLSKQLQRPPPGLTSRPPAATSASVARPRQWDTLFPHRCATEVRMSQLCIRTCQARAKACPCRVMHKP